MNIGNPMKAVPRYAKLFSEGIQGKAATLPHLGEFTAGQMDKSIYDAALYTNQHPFIVGGGAVGSLVLNNVLDNPWGKLVDTATFGLTDFDGSKPSLKPPSIEISMQPSRPQTYDTSGQSYFPNQVQFTNIPQLDEAERKKQIDYLQRKAATDLITINALRQQPGMEGYQ